jgi:hypothetical protein
LRTELDIVGKGIIPGGKVVHTESGPNWPLVSGARSFVFMVNRD